MGGCEGGKCVEMVGQPLLCPVFSTTPCLFKSRTTDTITTTSTSETSVEVTVDASVQSAACGKLYGASSCTAGGELKVGHTVTDARSRTFQYEGETYMSLGIGVAHCVYYDVSCPWDDPNCNTSPGTCNAPRYATTKLAEGGGDGA